MNIYFAFKSLDNLEDAGTIINKAIVIMEKLDRWFKESNCFGEELVLSNN
jgi:hypothetical protein